MNIEIFSKGCPACEPVIEAVRAAACPSCTITVRDMNDPAVAADAQRHGIQRAPAVVVDGELASCCKSGGPVDIEVLKSLGLGAG